MMFNPYGSFKNVLKLLLYCELKYMIVNID